jgi:hypothetical protein
MNKSVLAGILLMALIYPPVAGAAGEPEAQVEWSYTTGGAVTGVAVSADGNLVAASSQDGFLYGFNRSGYLLWNLSTDSLPQTLSMSSGGDYIVAGDETSMYLLDKTGKVIWKRGLFNINDVATSPDGSRIVAGTSDGFVRAYNNEGNELWTFKADFAVQGVGVSRDGSRVAAGTSDGQVYYLDQGGNLVWQFDTGRFVHDVEVLGDMVAVATERNRLFYLKYGSQQRSEYLPEDPLALGASSDGGFLAIGLTDGRVYSYAVGYKTLWDLDAGSIAHAVDTSSSGQYVVAGVGKQVRLITPPDRTPPVITFVSPKDGDVVSGSVTIDASFDEAVSSIVIEIDGEFAGGSLPRKWTTATYEDGEHSIKIKAIDKAGNTVEKTIAVVIEGASAATASQTLTEPGEETGTGKAIAGDETKAEAIKEEPASVKEVSPSPKVTPAPAVPPVPRKRGSKGTLVILAVVILALAFAYVSTTRRREQRYRWKGR